MYTERLSMMLKGKWYMIEATPIQREGAVFYFPRVFDELGNLINRESLVPFNDVDEAMDAGWLWLKEYLK